MAESYSVKAVLCAEDKNFSSMMKSCSSYADNLKNTLTSGIGFGAMAAIGSKAVSAIGSGLKSLTAGAISAGAKETIQARKDACYFYAFLGRKCDESN